MEFEINQGAYNISCPDAQCPKQGIIQLEEIEALVSVDEMEKHHRYRLNKGKLEINNSFKINVESWIVLALLVNFLDYLCKYNSVLCTSV